MQGSGFVNNKRRAPLAFRESLDSRTEENNEMKDIWNYETNSPKQGPANQGSNNHEFRESSRKQRNCKMYKVNSMGTKL